MVSSEGGRETGRGPQVGQGKLGGPPRPAEDAEQGQIPLPFTSCNIKIVVNVSQLISV